MKKAEVEVTLNDKDVKSKLEEISSRMKEVKTLRDKAFNEGNTRAFESYSAEMKKLSSEARSAQKQVIDVKAVLDNLSGASINDISASIRKARTELSAMKQTDPGYKDKQNQVETLTGKLSDLNKANREQDSWITTLSKNFNRYIGVVASVVAAMTGVVLQLLRFSDAYNKFQEKLGEVSALTGVTGDELEQLGNSARKMSHDVVDGGVRVTESANDILEAFKVMGGAKPELLKDSEALKAVTKDAIILNNASKGQLEPTVKSLALTMNQFGASAEQSRRYINVLAAGALEGSAEVQDISDSIVKFGAAANSANVSVEQSVGLIETLAEKGVKGEIAGTGIRNVLIKLQAGADDTNPKIVGLTQALENLRAKHLSTTQMVKIFGEENYIAGQILVENASHVKYFTDAVTGTNVALEQAITNTDNNNARLAQAKNRANDAAIELGKVFAPSFVTGQNAIASFMETLVSLVKTFHTWGPILASATAGIVAYTVAVKVASITKQDFKNITNRAKDAMDAFNKSIKENPWALAISLIVAAATALILFSKHTTESQKALADHKKALEDTASALDSEKIKTDQLVKQAQNERISRQDRLKALNDLKAASNGYLDKLTLENLKTGEGASLLKSYNKELEKRIWLQGNEKELTENIQEYNRIQRERFSLDGKSGTGDMAARLKKEAEKANTSIQGGAYTAYSSKDLILQNARAAQEKDTKLLEKQNALMEVRNLLYKEKNKYESQYSSLDVTKNGPKDDPAKPSAGSSEDAIDIARSARMKKIELDRKEQRITEDQYKEESIKSDIKYYNDKFNLTKIKESEKADLLKKVFDENEKLRQLYYARDLKELEREGTKEKTKLDRQHFEGKITDETYKRLQLESDLSFLTKKLELQKKSGEDQTDTLKEIAKVTLDAEKEINDLLLKAQEELSKAKIDNIKNQIDQQIAMEEDGWARELRQLQQRLITKEQLSAEEIRLNEVTNALILEKTQAHADKLTALNNAKALEHFDIQELKAQTDQARWDAQMARANKEREQELKLAGNDEKKRLEAEKKYAKSSLDIKNEKLDKEKKIGDEVSQVLNQGLQVLIDIFGKESAAGKALFLVQQAAAIGQVIFNTAIANAKAVAEFPLTAGQPWVTINTASAGVSIASILAQTFGAKGKKSGGYTDNDLTDDTIVDYVHSNEFVANAQAVRNPTIKPILNIIDIAQRNGSIRSINLPAIVAASAMATALGRKAGGYVQAPADVPTPAPNFYADGDPQIGQALYSLNRSIAMLNQHLEKPIKADVSLLGKNGFIEQQNKLNRIQKSSNF